MAKIKTDVPGLLKDTYSGAVVNDNDTSMEAYRKRKEFFRKNRDMNERLNNLEEDISEIKGLLQKLVNK